MTQVTVAEIAEQIRGVTYGKSDVSDRPSEGFLPVLRANNITEQGLTFDDLVYVGSNKISERQKIRKGDILIAASSGSISVVGKAAQANENMNVGFGAFCKVVRPSKRVDARYLGHFFRTIEYRRKMSELAEGANINNLKNEHIDSLALPLPPLEEQKRIAAILDQADDLRRKRQHALTRLNQLGQAIFYEMFGDGSSYEMAALNALGRVSTGSTPSTSEADSFGGSVPFVTPGDLGSGEPVKRSLTESGAAKSRTVVEGSTFVCCIGATIGKMGQATERSAFNQQLNAIEWGNRIIPTFGFFAVQQIKDVVIHKGKGASTTLPILKKSEFEKLTICCPPIEQQLSFSSRLEQINVLRHLHKSAMINSDKAFAALQHGAFSGEL